MVPRLKTAGILIAAAVPPHKVETEVMCSSHVLLFTRHIYIRTSSSRGDDSSTQCHLRCDNGIVSQTLRHCIQVLLCTRSNAPRFNTLPSYYQLTLQVSLFLINFHRSFSHISGDSIAASKQATTNRITETTKAEQ